MGELKGGLRVESLKGKVSRKEKTHENYLSGSFGRNATALKADQGERRAITDRGRIN